MSTQWAAAEQERHQAARHGQAELLGALGALVQVKEQLARAENEVAVLKTVPVRYLQRGGQLDTKLWAETLAETYQQVFSEAEETRDGE